ncbi:MAG: hypothetical protein M1831_002539 [Alyxoria varia]|nr:MAG: hypothetical protein M1831_002539 [Alyxoria varia]
MASKAKTNTGNSHANTLYFAYGSNLSQEQMAQRCPNSTYVGVAFLPGYRWHINIRGYANVIKLKDPVEAPAAEINPIGVYGLVYSLPERDEAVLDRYEGVPWAYSKVADRARVWPGAEDGWVDVNGQGVQAGTGDPGDLRDVLVYVNEKQQSDSQPNHEYIGRMNKGIANAIARGCPADKVLLETRKFIPE